MATLGEIEGLAKTYAEARDKLTATLNKLDRLINAFTRRYLPGIKVQVRIAKERESALLTAIDTSRSLFQRPKSIVLCGIKVGLHKGSGKLEWEDDDLVIKLIRRHLPEKADLLIDTKETVKRAGLNTLTVAELKSIGVAVGDTDDVAFAKGVDSDIEKLVKKYLDEKKDKEAKKEAA